MTTCWARNAKQTNGTRHSSRSKKRKLDITPLLDLLDIDHDFDFEKGEESSDDDVSGQTRYKVDKYTLDLVNRVKKTKNNLTMLDNLYGAAYLIFPQPAIVVAVVEVGSEFITVQVDNEAVMEGLESPINSRRLEFKPLCFEAQVIK